MPNVTSSLGSSQRYIPIVSSSQLGRYAGLFMHFASVAALNAAVTEELANITDTSPIWSDNQPMDVATENVVAGVYRLWKTGLQHARTVVLGPGKTVVLTSDSSTVLSTFGAPAGGTGNNGDIAVDGATGQYYTKSGGAWALSGSVVNLSSNAMVDFNSAVDSRADARVSAAIGSSVDASKPTVTQAEAEAGTLTSTRNWTPERVKQAIIALAPGSGSSLTIQDEGSPLTTAATTLNFVGSGVTVTGSGASKTVTIPGAGSATITVKEDNASVSAAVNTLDFLGADFDLSESPAGEINVVINSSIARTANVQPADATLTSLASLGSAADRIAYTTGVDAWAETPFTAAARSLLDDASTAIMLTTLGAQPADATLTALAGVATSANQGIYATATDAFSTYSLTAGGRALGGAAGTVDTFPYFSASNTVSLQSLTAAGRAILDDADATAQRATLGLVIGTNVQAQDATLSSLASLGTAADRLAYTTGVDTWAETPLTAAARTVLDDTSVGAMLTTLGGQPLDSDLTAIAALSANNDDVIQRKGGVWVNRSMVQLDTDLQAVLPAVVIESSTARTLTNADNNKIIRCTSASAVTITVPTGFSGATCTVVRAGAGTVTFAASGTTLNGASLTIDGQYRSASILPTGVANTFDLIGATGDFVEDVQDTVAAQFAAGSHTNISFSYNDTTGAISATVSGTGGDASTNTASSVDSELSLFSGTGGKTFKRATTTGVLKATSGVLAAAVAGTDYLAPAAIGTTVQGLDAGLTSIAGLTTGANTGIYTTALDAYATYSLTAGGRAIGGVAGTADTFPYFSASNTVTLQSLTAAGRAILDDADATAQRATLGLVIGTNVQAQDADLQTIAGLTPTNDDVMQYKSGAWANRTLAQLQTDLLAVPPTVVVESTTSRILSAADNNKIIRCTNAASVTITVPTTFNGCTCTVVRAGAGSVTFSASSTTLNGASLVIDGQYRSAALLPTGVANTFDLIGATGDFVEDVQDIMAAQLAAGSHSNISFSYNDTTGAISATVTGSGGDASTNTSSSVDSEIAIFSGTGGKTLKRATTSGLLKASSGVLGAAVAGTDYVAPDATLTALAGLSTSANQGIYATGTDAFTTYSLTAGGRALGGVAGTSDTFPYFSASNTVTLQAITTAGRAILDDADATAQRATLGLVIGTNVQAFDADLGTIAGLTPTNDDVMQYKAGAWANRTMAQLQTDLLAVPPTIVIESTTARTLSASDNGKVIRCTNAGATTITVNTSFSGCTCTIVRGGAGSVTVATSGTTINGVALTIDGQYRSASLLPTGVANTFDLIGALGDFTEDVQDIVAAQLAAGTHSNISFSYNDTTGAISATVTGSGGDASTNTASSVDSEVALFSGTGGKTIKRATGSGIAVLTSGVLSTVAGYAAEATVASATTTDIGAAASQNVSITGTTTITGFGTVAAGTHRYGRFTGALTLTHNATSLILPGGANITTVAGDRFIAESLGSGNWVVLVYTKNDGTAVVGGGGGGDASTNTSSSVDSELALFSGTAGKTIKRATTTGVLKATSGVLAAAVAGTDYLAPAAIGTTVQGLDATLTALAGLTIAANSLTIGTGADAFSQTTFAANTFPGRSSTGSLVAKTMTDFGFSLVDDADATAARTTLGLGTIATVAAPAGTVVGTSDAQTLSAKIYSMNAILGSNNTYEGTIVTGRNAGATIAQWDLVYLDASFTWQIADSNGTGTYPAIGMAVAGGTASNPLSVLLFGTVRNDAWNWAAGPVYLSTTAGGMTQTQPATTGDKVQVVGFATSFDTIIFAPSRDYFTRA